ncbi:MAG: hypothetical protein GXP38_04720 [Chloroflexi bacterium]|nr:hypothetical protein [Chloroflexota bacterium]
MKAIDVVYLYEHVVRELDVACAVKHYLERDHGLSVELVQYPYGVHDAITRVRPHMVLLPFCYANCYAFYKRDFGDCLVEWPKAVYVNLAWEQLLYKGNRASKTPGGDFALKHVFHHAWSETFRDFLLAQGIPAHHVFLNGHPAYTLYDAPYKTCFKQRSDLAQAYSLDPHKRWVFFPENYNWMFYTAEDLERHGQYDQKRKQVEELVRFCQLSFAEVMRWFGALARTGDFEIIIRPRPATPVERFAAKAAEALPDISANVHIIKEETVREWILASDVVLTSHSTSLIEASVAGKPAYMLEPHPIPPSLHAPWHDLAEHLQGEAAFQQAMTALDGRRESHLGQWARSTLMANGDSIWNLAQFVADLYTSRIGPLPPPTYRSLMPPEFRFPRLAFAYHKFRGRKRRHTMPKAINPKYERDLLTKEQLQQRMARWRACQLDYQPLAEASAPTA